VSRGTPTVLTRHRFDVDQYQRMMEAGVLSPDARVELLDGELFEMHTIGSRHFASVIQLSELLTVALSGHALISVQMPVHLSRFSMPEPDVAVLRPREDSYARGLPEPVDTLLLIEVADSSLPKDRTAKLPLYAMAGIREVWIVDLTTNAIDVHRDPAGEAYAATTRHTDGVIAPLAFPQLQLDVAAILPKA
jgi:Uma2 family endonuclease